MGRTKRPARKLKRLIKQLGGDEKRELLDHAEQLANGDGGTTTKSVSKSGDPPQSLETGEPVSYYAAADPEGYEFEKKMGNTPPDRDEKKLK